jgi:phosphoserine aminotransferase
VAKMKLRKVAKQSMHQMKKEKTLICKSCLEQMQMLMLTMDYRALLMTGGTTQQRSPLSCQMITTRSLSSLSLVTRMTLTLRIQMTCHLCKFVSQFLRIKI